jgi:hypothetical protein
MLSPRAIFVLAGVLALSAPLLFGRRLVRAADADCARDAARAGDAGEVPSSTLAG